VILGAWNRLLEWTAHVTPGSRYSTGRSEPKPRKAIPRESRVAVSTQSASLEERYELHNRARGSGFVFGGRQRTRALLSATGASPGLLLDLGCRDGSLTDALGFDGEDVVGLDIDMESLRAARSDGRLRGCLANLWDGRLPFRSGQFHVVLAGEVLEHLPFPDQIVAEAARVLRDDGSFAGSVPNAYRLRNRLRFAMGRPFEDDPTHLRSFSQATLRAMLAASFGKCTIKPCVGRFAHLWPTMTANDLVWRASAPVKRAGDPVSR